MTHEDKTAGLFPLGRIATLQGALEQMDARQRQVYYSGDWGFACPEDKQNNDKALIEGGRILSAYPIDSGKPCKGFGDNCLWGITAADRSVTTWVLPEEY